MGRRLARLSIVCGSNSGASNAPGGVTSSRHNAVLFTSPEPERLGVTLNDHVGAAAARTQVTMEAEAAELPDGLRLSEAETEWLQAFSGFAEKNLLSLPQLSGLTRKALAAALVRCVQKEWRSSQSESALPLSYSFVSVRELVAQRDVPCRVDLTMDGSEGQCAADAKGDRPSSSREALSRSHLILVGFLTDRFGGEPGGSPSRGIMYLRDGSGVIPCECLSLSANVLEKLVLLPRWAYVPQSIPGLMEGRAEGGYLEVPSSPLPLFPVRVAACNPVPVTALPVESAALLLNKRSEWKGTMMNIYGKVLRVSPLLHIYGKSRFFFLLSSSTTQWVPVSVEIPSKLKWQACLRPGEEYAIANLNTCALRCGETEHWVFSMTPSSLVLPSSRCDLTWLVMQRTSQQQSEGRGGTPPGPERAEDSGTQELSDVTQPGGGTQTLSKESKIVTYRIRDAHMLKATSEHFLPFILCCCLRSSLSVREFSGLGTGFEPFSSRNNLYIYLLFKYQLELCHYLWVVQTVQTLIQRFSYDITKYCNSENFLLYVQFVTGDVHVLNRSAALAKRDLQRKAGESSVKGTPRQKQPCPSGLPGAAENSCIPSEDSETSHRAKVPRMEQVGNCIGEVAGSNQDDTHPAETASLSPSGSESCVTLLFLVTQKEGPMLKNSQLNVPGCPTNSRAPPPLLLSFEVLALQIGEPRVWANRGEMQGIPEIQDVCRNFTELRLLFLSDSVKWCSCIHPERLYRLVVPQSTDVMVFKNFGCQRWNSPLCLTLQDGWEVQYVADLSALSPYQASFWPQISESLQLHSISEIQSKSFSHTLVSFIGRVCDRVTCAPDIRLQYTTFLTGKKDEDIFHRSDLCLKLDVCDPSDASRCLTVYIDFTLLPHVPGLLPGAMVLFYRHERIFSRSAAHGEHSFSASVDANPEN
nr:PREDICTED: CST complex subunit CTC1-like [Latimeria chalumnae]|eukprot:XP_014353706.1 PREDICTED: CST complex subunit CTC1-like [Latimeria chalumnae]